MGTLKADMVNIAVHGHNPVLSDIIVSVSREMESEAAVAGAAGVNIVGICCTGNELMERHGIPSCTHSVSQEMALLTGAVDAWWWITILKLLNATATWRSILTRLTW